MKNEARLIPRRIWWVVLAGILCIAGALRYTGYNFSLPYIDHPDEPAYLLSAQMVIDNGSPKQLGMQGYPPGIIALNVIILRLLNEAHQAPTMFLGITRLISISFSMGVVILIALLGYRIANPLAGLTAAMIWAVAPKIVELSRYGTADNFVTFFSLLALFLTLTGTRFNRNGWIYSGVIAIMLAVVFKYQAVSLLPMVLIWPLSRLRRNDLDPQRIINEFGRVMLLIGAFGVWLLLIFPALEASQSPYWSAAPARFDLPSLISLISNIRMIVEPLARTPLWLAGGLGLLLLLSRRAHVAVRTVEIAGVLVALLCWTAGGSLYGALGDEEFRQFVTVAALLTVLVGTGLSLIIWIVRFSLMAKSSMAARLAPVALLATVIGLSAGDLQASMANARQRTLPDQRNLLTAWADRALPSGGYIGLNEVHKVFNPDWGGYTGIDAFPLVEMATLTDRPLSDWRERGAEYAIVRYEEFDQLPEDIRSGILPLRAFPPDDNLTGPAMMIVRLSPVQHSVRATLGYVHLVGYDRSSAFARAGGIVEFRQYWRTEQAFPAAYQQFNHLLDSQGRLVAQIDGPPAPDPRRTTDTWDDPGETVIGSAFQLSLPVDLNPGVYQLVTGFYRPDTGERLAFDGVDHLSVFDLRVD